MIYVKVNSGLCNQMYFFSTAYALSKEWKEELVIDCDVDGNPEWTYLLDEFQMPSCKKVVYPLRYHMGKEYVKVAPEIKEHAVIIDETYFEEIEGYLTIPKEKFLSEYPGKDIYLKGTFLKRQMFTKYLPDLRKIFTLKEPSPFVREFEKRIAHVTAVGVHIRKKGFAVLGDDNGMDFFMAAIVYMRQRFENTRFYIFSDEPDFVKESMGSADDIYYVDAMNGYRGDIEEFVCLTKCHHYILTRRSTYGRMAEILNDSEEKVSVLYGGNTWNDSEERFHFMPQEEVGELSKLFAPKAIEHDFQETCLSGKTDKEPEQIFVNLGLNSGGITSDDRKKILYRKAKMYADRKEYGQAVHLCRLIEEQYGGGGMDFHEYFGDLLCRYGAVREAVVEYVCASKEKEIQKDILGNGSFSDYKKLLECRSKKHYVIVQYGAYTSQYMSEMQMLGLILARMGNHVSFIFKRDFPDIVESDLNETMMNWNRNADHGWMDYVLKNGFTAGRFSYGYPCYDYSSVRIHKGERLHEIAAEYPGEEMILVGRDPEFISADNPYRKVFVDFSYPFDEARFKDMVGEDMMKRMYECADLVVTGDAGYARRQGVIRINDGLMDRYRENIETEIPCYEPTVYTDDYLDIALQIALNSM